jgi:hypothetical protein
MHKPGLGKSLGGLMNGDEVAGKKPSAGTRPKSGSRVVGFGRGLNTLVSAGNEAYETPKKKPILPAWYFLVADILLLAYTTGIAFHAPRPFDVGTILFCVTAIGLGCLMGIFGALRVGE